MMTVAILINGQVRYARTAVNRGKCPRITGQCLYDVDDGSQIAHRPDDGAVALARKLLDTIKVQK